MFWKEVRNILGNWDKKIAESLPWNPFSWMGKTVNDIVENEMGKHRIIAVQTERRAGKDTAILSLLDQIVTKEKNKYILVVDVVENSVKHLRKNIGYYLQFEFENETSARIAGKDVTLLFSLATTLAKGRAKLDRCMGADIVVINNADKISSEDLVAITRMAAMNKISVVMFGTNKEDGKTKSAWLYYLNHPDTVVYKVLPRNEPMDSWREEAMADRSSIIGSPPKKREELLRDSIKRCCADMVSFHIGFPS